MSRYVWRGAFKLKVWPPWAAALLESVRGAAGSAFTPGSVTDEGKENALLRRSERNPGAAL